GHQKRRHSRRGHRVVQAVVHVAHHDEPDAAEQLARDGRADENAEDDVVGAHRWPPRKRAISSVPTNDRKASVTATPMYEERWNPSASRTSASVTTVPAVCSPTSASTRDARTATQPHGKTPSSRAVAPHSQTFTAARAGPTRARGRGRALRRCPDRRRRPAGSARVRGRGRRRRGGPSRPRARRPSGTRSVETAHAKAE